MTLFSLQQKQVVLILLYFRKAIYKVGHGKKTIEMHYYGIYKLLNT
jgi:hypothetical protein